MPTPVSIFWFRRDLRLDDNAGLYHALKGDLPVVPIFIFDRHILDELEDRNDARVHFIHQALTKMQTQLLQLGSTLDVRHGYPPEIFSQLLNHYNIKAVYTNHDYEPYARKRDDEIEKLLARNGIAFHSFKDQVLFEKNEVLKDDGKPYTIFTPYSRRWKEKADDIQYRAYPVHLYKKSFHKQAAREIPSLASIGFAASSIDFPPATFDRTLISQYGQRRDFPSLDATSRLSVHLRFGTISIRQLALEAVSLSETFLNELVWREFYQMILWHFPQVVTRSFKPAYDKIRWRNNENEFGAWCNGMTGYPIVDAGMRELNATGFMHNRVRMITASFLTKHLLIDWRWGEAYFAKKLIDYELASNNGGWQWAAGSGCDAAPYFRIFNPALQTKKFDAELNYIRRWIPEHKKPGYPTPIVGHEFARERCLKVYKEALNS